MYLFFFFKQKTAYERRISDWSSDVCSSDLLVHSVLEALARLELRLLGCRDLNPLTRAGIAPFGRSTLANGEGAEAHEANLISRLQRVDDRVEHAIDRLRGIGLRPARLLSDDCDQISSAEPSDGTEEVRTDKIR